MVYDHDRIKEAMPMATLLIRPTNFCCEKSTPGQLEFSMAIELRSLSMRSIQSAPGPITSHFHAVLSMLSGLFLCNMFLFFFFIYYQVETDKVQYTFNAQPPAALGT